MFPERLFRLQQAHRQDPFRILIEALWVQAAASMM
jgi:hypothetical protein